MTPQASHSSSHTGSRRAAPRRASLRAVLLATSALASAALSATLAHAGNATWNPGNRNFNIGANWTGTPDKQVPDGIATFNASSQQNVFFSQATPLGGITLNQDAGEYIFDTNGKSITFTGAGLSVGSNASLTLNNNGASHTTFLGDNTTAGQALININDGVVTFTGQSKAGSSILNVNGDPANNIFPVLTFAANSSADQAKITNNAFVNFDGESTAGQATIDNKGSLSFGSATGDKASAGAAKITNELSGTLNFHESTSAGTATITNSSQFFQFLGDSTAANATIVNHGFVAFLGSSTTDKAFIESDGTIFFKQESHGGTSRIKLDNGRLDISALTTGGGRRSVRSKAAAASCSVARTWRLAATMGRPYFQASSAAAPAAR